MKYSKLPLSDATVEAAFQRHEKLQCSLILSGPIMFWEAEIIGPFDSPMFGYRANGFDPITAKKRLSDKLGREFGFIGRLEEKSPRRA